MNVTRDHSNSSPTKNMIRNEPDRHGGFTAAVLVRIPSFLLNTTHPNPTKHNKPVSVPSLEPLTEHGGHLGVRLFGLAGHESVSVGAEVPLPAVKVDSHLRLALGGSVGHYL